MPNNVRKQRGGPQVDFKVLLNRAKPLPEDEMEQVLRRLRVYDPLLEEDPWVQEYGARREAQGKAEGQYEGKLQSMRQNIETIIQLRFPDLYNPVMNYVEHVKDPATLQQVLIALAVTQDNEQARNYLKHIYAH